jgi:glutamine amidotransferase
MCRHLAYLGQPVALSALVLDPPHALSRQAYAPRRQRFGSVNVDGFGVGWYSSRRPEPVRYRRAQSIWSDQSFASLAPTVVSTSVLAAVRSATPGYPCEESGVAPFTHDRWLFSHNGVLGDLQLARKSLVEAMAWVPDALAPVDSALLFGLAVAHWQAGADLATGLAQTIHDVVAVGGGRLNLLATDGARIAGTTWGDTLFVRQTSTAIVLASEPHDDDLGWRPVPPRSLVEASDDGVDITPL